ncbi:MAG: 30S ribosomal protein S9 [bacterium]|nr:30S ribosomal protein S9 [bacterium]
METKKYYATGRRKTAVARVWVSSGSGKIMINREELDEYVPVYSWRQELFKPFLVTGTTGQFDVFATVKGGGKTGQVGAIRHGIARALEKVEPSYRTMLKKEGLLTRDARKKERKKYGRKGARARFQFSKR